MIRKSTINITYANKGKLKVLDELFEEYQRVVNQFIDYLWNNEIFNGSFVKETSWLTSWISARLKQCAAKQALAIVKSQRKKQNKTKPTFVKDVIELDQRFTNALFDVNSFDIWIKLTSIGNKIKLFLPSKKHFHFNKFFNDGWNLKSSVRLRKVNDLYFVDLFLEKHQPKFKNVSVPTSLGVDIGYKKLIVDSDGNKYGNNFEFICNKISKKVQGSNGFQRALQERNAYVDKVVKGLDLTAVSQVFYEELKDVKHKSKGKISKLFNNKLQRWIYPRVIRRIRLTCETIGVQCFSVDPSYTSQTCSRCHNVSKESRKGEIYSCVKCGEVFDADHNAAINILRRGLSEHMVPMLGT